MTGRLGLIALLVVMGAGWGLTIPLATIVVSEGYQPFGIVFWQSVVSTVILTVYSWLRGTGLPFGRSQMRVYLTIALLGSLLPGLAYYWAAARLPAGVLAIAMSLVPMFAFPVALYLRTDSFAWVRLFGLAFGLVGVVLLVAPEISLPERVMIAALPVALLAPLFYALEGNAVARWGTAGLTPVQVLLGASLLGIGLNLPLAVGSGQWISPLPPYGAPDAALIASTCIGTVIYTIYVWMIGRTGSVFAAQVSYLVTGFGVFWAIMLLGESYSAYFWAALACLAVGLFLVQPRPTAALAPAGGIGETGQ